MNVGEKIMAKDMNKSKTMRHILSFSADPLLRLTSQKTGIYVPNMLWREKCYYFKYF